jgi:hypothetical protein
MLVLHCPLRQELVSNVTRRPAYLRVATFDITESEKAQRLKYLECCFPLRSQLHNYFVPQSRVVLSRPGPLV